MGQGDVPGVATVRRISRLVPSYCRSNWLAEWESELRHTRDELLAAGGSDAMTALRLRMRALDAARDAVWVRRRNGGASSIGRDVRHAIRLLRRQPLFAALVVMTLSLGVGATTAIFSALDGLLLRPLPFEDPDRLVEVMGSSPSGSSRRYLDWETAEVWQAQNGVFESARAHTIRSLTLTRPGEPHTLAAFLVQPGYLEMLGIRPAHGRTFSPDEAIPGRDRVVLLSDEIWRSRFGRDPGIVGGTVYLDEEPYTVIGVLPPQLRRMTGGIPGLLLPLPNVPSAATRTLMVIGRLRAGLPLAVAQERLDGVSARLETERPRDEGWGVRIAPIARSLGDDTRRGLHTLAAAAGLLLLVACINAAGLLFVRGVALRPELSVRAALGGTRFALFRQSLVESLVLSAVSGAFGIALAYWGVKALTALAPPSLLRFSYNAVAVDTRVLMFALALSILTGVGFGVAPALRAAGASSGLSGRRSTTTGRSELRVRSFVQAMQIALTVILLTGAGLLGKSFMRLMAVDPGYEPRGLLVVQYGAPRYRYDDGARTALQVALDERLRALPGVEDLTWTMGGVPAEAGFHTDRNPETREGTVVSAGADMIVFADVDTAYFRVMGIDIERGRPFQSIDLADGSTSVIIDADFARALWPDGLAAGRSFRLSAEEEWLTVVGVSQDVKLMGPDDDEFRFAIFYPSSPERLGAARIAIRVALDPATLIPQIHEAIRALDPALPVSAIEPAAVRYDDAFDQPRFVLVMMSIFATLALILAAVGVYGLVSFIVVRRTREIGIRKAIGARDREIVGTVLGRGIGIACAGLGVGIIGAVLLSRYIAALLFDVPSIDPATLFTVSAVLFASCIVALVLPARRAVRVAAADAIREP